MAIYQRRNASENKGKKTKQAKNVQFFMLCKNLFSIKISDNIIIFAYQKNI